MHPRIRRVIELFSSASPWDSVEILREELFSIERLEQHAGSLAAAQKVTQKPQSRRSLAARLRDNESVLLAAYHAIAAAVGEGRTITPSAEWLLDNYHLVDEQIREVRRDLPPGYYRQLPKLADGPFAGYPRVFAIAWAFVAHNDSRFDPETLRRFVRAYQRVQPLTIGELWAVAITIRIVLVENLRRAAQSIISARTMRQEADAVADRLLGVNGQAADPGALFASHGRDVRFSSAFAVQLVQRLRDQDPRLTPALPWLEERLAAQGTSFDEIVHTEHQRQGVSNVTVRNIITSMRLMSEVDWAELFESISLVDDVLRTGGTFAAMDFATRNLYRSAIEDLARSSPMTELAIAELAMSAAAAHEGARERDPGYHLISAGRAQFEKTVGYKPSIRHWPARIARSSSASDYIFAIVFTGALVLMIPLWLLHSHGLSGVTITLFALLGAIPAIDVGVALVNRAITRGVGANILPGLALREGVPAHLRTLVAVPVLLTTPESIAEQIERLEIHYLASPEGDLHFALLSDWSDAPTEHVEGDEALLEAARAGIAQLNILHGPATAGARFVLLHRRRLWSASQRCWMGWERKRGKLHELNELLRGSTTTSFMADGAEPPWAPADVRYVLTLDADTRLPRETVRRLVGKMAHPLNQPRFDTASGRVTAGYAVLQPRVTPSLPVGREGSAFQRIFSSAAGVDPYAAAVSDVYQDLLGEGSYAGKGIYDVDAFEASLSGRVTEGTLLSHDLFEGIFARAGLASDVEVVEQFPSRYDVAALRQHRWARGDWQLLPWLLGRGDALGAARGRSRIPLIGIWKMLDNLRRTLSAPASVLALAAGWTLTLHSALPWTLFILATLAVPTLIPLLGSVSSWRDGVTVRSHLRVLRIDAWLALSQMALSVVFLAHQAWLMSDAIGRTVFRLYVTRRNLLEWTTAAQASADSLLTLGRFYRTMSGSAVVAIATAVLLFIHGSDTWPIALPFIVLWAAAPAVALRISRFAPAAARAVLSIEDARTLRLVARRTWRFFETFVTQEDNHLPPDNFQEDPHPVLAHRTSPTNLGLYLLSSVAARDFGWAGTRDVVARLEATLTTMSSLKRCRGHFFNWYDTRDLRPLDPLYVSSVDSGNLAAHLIALANACREWQHPSSQGGRTLGGIVDAVDLAGIAMRELPEALHARTITRDELGQAHARLEAALLDPPPGTDELAERLSAAAPLATTLADMARALTDEFNGEAHAEVLHWADSARRTIESALAELASSLEERGALDDRLARVAATALDMAAAMDFGFLLDPQRRLLSIGFRAVDGMLDPSCYDLLASEARLASFIAIAKGDVPARHWFRLGRPVTPIGHGAALISWSGSMFEYLMPSLVMRAPAGSLLEQTNRLIVRRQMSYGATRGIPWGISESAFNARDLELTYQYSNFGVPGLGLKRGLSENIVVAPYATALATMIDPTAAVRNFERLAAIGATGRYGFYEAIDFTPSRLPEGADHALVRAFMAHHQGMTIVAIGNALHDAKMRERFHAEPGIQATELLLQERTPRDVSIAHPRAEEVKRAERIPDPARPDVRRVQTPHDITPQTHLLSNGRYAVMLTATGSGYSRWQDLAVTRWREDTTREDSGSYIFLRDAESGALWSAGHQPCATQADRYEASFTEDRAEIVRSDAGITTRLEVIVSPEDSAEVRRVSLTNSGNRAREIEVTSYCEVVLAPHAADVAHPAFSKLFVQTEFLPKLGALLATRRRRSPEEPQVWSSHHAVVEGVAVGKPEVETDRARFLGRGREIRTPIAMMDGKRLSNSVGTVLDAVFALRYRLRVPAGATVRIAFWTGVATSRQAVLELLDKHHDSNAYVRAATLAWTQAQVQLRHLGIDAAQANLFQQLAGHLLFANASMRPSSDSIRRGAGSANGLWAQGISGDLPILLLRIDAMEDIAIVRQLLQAHEYWRMKQLAVDLVILNERASSYVQDLQGALESLMRMNRSRSPVSGDGVRGSVYILRADIVPPPTRALLSSVARAVLSSQSGSLEDQLERLRNPVAVPRFRPPPNGRSPDAPASVPPPRDLEFFNGIGGFADDGREYVVQLDDAHTTPAPWINVVANPQFGFQVAAEGSGYTWACNSRENQLTAWSNDPVTDRPGEVLYVKDEESGELWAPTATPFFAASATHEARHGQGYSRFRHESRGLGLELLMYVPLTDPIKISRLKICNTESRSRVLSITAYAEWVLGSSRSGNAAFIETEIDAATQALFACNPWNASFGSRVAFLDLAGRQTEWTADRREFLGRHGALAEPAALLSATPLSGRAGAGLDPCGALRSTVHLEPHETIEVVVFIGQATDAAAARALIEHYRAANLEAVFRSVVAHWDEVLGTVQVKTPDRPMDILLNRWALYQTLACRMWARAAFYQASGAYGFRDQLQDSMALTVSQPGVMREHLLRAAGRQFTAGDVQHWWLPESGRGVRTRISDDRPWLAYAAAHYVESTGDTAILDQKVPFIEGRELSVGEHDAFFEPGISEETASLFEHCARALDRSLAVGEHGLPLMGTGDWNDGMNRVGEQGRGESVWLGWFLHKALTSFTALARVRGEKVRCERWLAHASALQSALERNGWDGRWYRRGYFDDGTPLGSADSTECRIDSIAQSWSVLSGAAAPARAAQAMEEASSQLFQRDMGLALLFTPPFDHTPLDPGYIKGYPPGIRENGGQYTHAATWSVIALAMLNRPEQAFELFSALNPVNRTATRANVHRYKVEPYVVAADVYSVMPHTGRGGWTWYTGSAGWMYRAGLEGILGFRVLGDRLKLTPCIPARWPGFEITFRYRTARYEIKVEKARDPGVAAAHIELDGQPLPPGTSLVPLVDDGRIHQVRLVQL